MSNTGDAHRHEAFRKVIPYELIPTNLPGVFSSPALPGDLDPHSIDQRTMIRHGLLWRRPDSRDRHALHSAWRKLFSPEWRRNRIMPIPEVQPGKTRQLQGMEYTESGSTSKNWSGSFVQGPPGSFTSIIGFWQIPAVSMPAEPPDNGEWDSSTWIGIDGAYGSNDVLQAGVLQSLRTPDLMEFKPTQVCTPDGDPYPEKRFPWR
jgi:hypothetical protein